MPVVAIVGPTAVGKTAASILLAERLGAEIVSVDSRQVYRYLDVGADKISPEIRRRILHHMIDVADPDQVFSAADFVSGCLETVERIRNRGRIPLFVGGTPFYFEALFGRMLSEDLPRDEPLRRELERIAEEQGAGALHAMLREADPESAVRLHENDVRRVVRALEICRLTGESVSGAYGKRRKMASPGKFDILYIGLSRERRLLFEGIERRVREQFASGFVEEVEWLLSNGFDERFPSMQGFGYKDILAYLRGKCTLEEAAELDMRQTKAFSRRQMTWFGKFSPIVWYDTGDCPIDKIVGDIEKEVENHLGKGSFVDGAEKAD
jgi:tRNA dimethylallyltransferase